MQTGSYITLVLIAMTLIFTGCSSNRSSDVITSPDKAIEVTVSVADSGKVFYAVKHNGESVMEPSRLGLVRDDSDFAQGLRLVDASGVEPVHDTYMLLHGKKQNYSYTANRRVYHFENSGHQKMDVVFQVSNDGVAFRYVFPDSTEQLKKISREVTSFRFSDSTRAWLQPRARAKSGWQASNPSYEEYYQQDIVVKTAAAADTGWIFPALFRANNHWVLLSETAPDRDYCGARLLKGHGAGEFVIGFPEASETMPGGPVYPQSKLPWQTPWRFMAIGSMKTIVESTLGTDLAKPATNNNYDYVKPGRASWSWVSLKDDSIVYDVQHRFIDYAAQMRWEYCLIDVDWDTKIGYDKIKELADYAAGKHVGLILWYNSAGSWNTVPYHPRDLLLTHEGREKEFARIAAMGIKGIKVDFFGGDGQSVMAYYQDIIEDAARHNLVVNCHGSTLPRGLQRTYPNLVSMEAVKGFEFVTFEQRNADQQPTHCAMLPFVRNVFDPMDFTPVCFSEVPRITRRTSNAFELALAVLFHSGVQHYAEKPQGMRAVPDSVKELMRTIPVSWEETQFVDGYPGKFVVMARKAAGKWYVAGINGESTGRSLSFKLPFIQHPMQATIIKDGVDNRSFQTKPLMLGADGSFSVQLKGHGGFVIVISE